MIQCYTVLKKDSGLLFFINFDPEAERRWQNRHAETVLPDMDQNPEWRGVGDGEWTGGLYGK